jgi:Protein of unknown function (DUF3619)
MDEQWNPEPIMQLLNRSLEEIDQSSLARLHAARLLALNSHEVRTATLPLFAWAGVHVIRHASAYHHRIYHWIGAILLAASIFNGIAYYGKMRWTTTPVS